MRRYPLVIAGTVAGATAVLVFPTHRQGTSLTSTAPAAPATTTTTGSSGVTTSTTTSPATTRTATGSEESFRYGDIAVKVTVSGSKVTGVTVASIDETDGRSQEIDRYAVPQLEQQAVSVGSANIDGVSGATFTSQAFAGSLSSALSKLGLA